MKKLISILLLLILVTIKCSIAQNTAEINKANKSIANNGEVYFSFNLKNEKNIEKLNSIISIDNVLNNKSVFKCFAYANAKQFEKFKTLGIDFKTLTTPSEQFKAVMSNGVKSTKDWNVYPTYEDYVQMMNDFATNYPDLCTLENIGSTVENRELLVMKISDNVTSDETEPEFYYTSSMHGDEITGYVLMLRLIDYLLTNYNLDTTINNLVNNTEIWINPLANPDGTFAGGNTTVNGATRYNANGVDLNRNYPDPEAGVHPDGNSHQPENIAQMEFMNQHHFILSSNIHGGAEVMNYPWDTWSRLHADDEWFKFISHEFADTAQAHSPSGYLSGFNDGITNGYQWYSITGGRQDYVTYFMHGREITYEISDVKTPAASSLPNYWEYNYRSFINYIEQCQFGITGFVTDAVTKSPIKAMITIANHDKDSSMVFSNSTSGEYYRLIEEGTWEMTISAYGYISQVIQDVTTSNYQKTNLNIALQPAETISFNGKVQNGFTNEPLRNVKVQILNTPLEEVYSGSDGSFLIENVLEGIYDIQLSKDGYSTIIESIELIGSDSVFNFSIFPATIINFENNNFEEADFSFEGNADWITTGNTAYNGSFAVQSGNISDNQSSTLILDVNVLNGGQMSFVKKVSSEAGYDFLKFFIDNVNQDQWSGNVDWSESIYNLTRGQHSLKWTYSKDASQSNGSDAAWIDYISLPLIEGANFPPSFNSIPLTNAQVDILYEYNILVNDINIEDPLFIGFEILPTWLSFENIEQGVAIISGTPSPENVGIDTVQLFCTDGIDTVYQDFNITIAPNSVIQNKLPHNVLNIYPNPTSNNLFIEVNSEIYSQYQFLVFDITGKKLIEKNIDSFEGRKTISINLTDVNSGQYYVQIINNSHVETYKFVKASN